MTSAENRPLREYGDVFDDVATEYDAARSSYPPELVDAAIAAGGLDRNSAVLELGSGTGKLTDLLVERGLQIRAVEPGANLVAAARRKLADSGAVQFEIARFEDAELPEGAYDAVFSATAFHWLDPALSWKRVASLLRPGGLLALLTYIGVHDERAVEMEEELLAILAVYVPRTGKEWGPLPPLETVLQGARERLANASETWDWIMSEGRHGLARPEARALFREVDVTAVLARASHTAEELIALIRTTSLYFMVAPDRRQAFEDDYRGLVERCGGVIPYSRASILMTARSSAAGLPD